MARCSESARLEALEGEGLADDHDPAAIADELDALHANLDGRGLQRADGTVRILDQCGRGVLGLHRLRAAPRETPDARRRTGEVAEQVERVGRLVHQDAAALAGPRPTPAGCAVVGLGPVERVDDRHAHELAELACRDQLVCPHDHRPEPLLEADGEEPTGTLRGGDHRVGGVGLDRERLLAENMRARLERGDRERRVGGMRRADDDHVRREREQLVVAAAARFVDVADPDQLRVLDRFDRGDVERRDHARADDAVAERHAPSLRAAATFARVAASRLPSRS